MEESFIIALGNIKINEANWDLAAPSSGQQLLFVCLIEVVFHLFNIKKNYLSSIKVDLLLSESEFCLFPAVDVNFL